MNFDYGEKEMLYLKSKDKKLGEVIDALGHIDRPVNPDVFAFTVESIVGQLISKKAHETIWHKMVTELGTITPETIMAAGKNKIQSFGMTFKKADYTLNLAHKVKNNEIDLDSFATKSDHEIIKELSSLEGIGEWTAEMVLLHCLQRPDILSYKDLAIIKGMKMVYHHKDIDKKRFDRYRKRFTPFGSVASIYFWAVSAGAIAELTDKKRR